MLFKEMRQRKKIGQNISIVFRATRMMIEDTRKKINMKLSMAQLPILSFLLDADLDGELKDKVVAQDFITKSLGIDKATTTRAVKQLVEDKYVVRVRDKRDKRAYNLSLTRKGKMLKLGLVSRMKTWTDIVYDGVSQEEMDVLERVLEKMKKNVIKYKEDRKYEGN